MSGSRYDRINAIGSRQRGRITRQQLLAAAVTTSEMSTLVNHGYLRRRIHAVYAIGHEAPTPLADETEALLAVGPGAAVSDAHAGAIWGMCPAPGGLVHVTAERGIRVRGVVAHRSRLITPDDVCTHDGLIVTSAAWTLLDLAGMPRFGTRRLEWAYDHALVHRLVRREEIASLVDRVTGRSRGIARLRALLDDGGDQALTRSDAEELMLAIVRGTGLPAPQVNVRFHGWELDFFWARHGVVVEIDGFRFHSSPKSFERDRAKDAALRARGLIVARFSWRQVREEPLLVAAQLGRLLASAASG